MAGRRGPHRLRDQLGQSGHRAQGQERRAIMSSTGVVEAIGEVRKRTGTAPDLFSFCLGGTLVAIALAWLAAKGRADEVNSATLIGSLVDFSDMRDWAAFVHEGHLTALEDHLEAQGYADSLELQRLFAAMRANDLIWSSVVNHYLLDQPGPAVRPALLVRGWRAHPGRLPQELQPRPAARQQAEGARRVHGRRHRRSTSRAIATPMLVIALKDDHVSAWEAVYRRRAPSRRRFRSRRIGPQCRRDQSAGRQQAWLLDQRPAARRCQGSGSRPRRATKAAGGRGGPSG